MVRADVTVTFGTLKPGLLVDPGAAHAGLVELVDLGLGPLLGGPALEGIDEEDVRAGWPWAGRDDDKYARGALGVFAGSRGYPGAAALCVAGALRSGSGYVRVAAEPGVAEAVRLAWPEAVVTVITGSAPTEEVGRVQAWVAGPGLGLDDVTGSRLRGPPRVRAAGPAGRRRPHLGGARPVPAGGPRPGDDLAHPPRG